MAETYQAKLDWKAEDQVTESDVNRWEKGINDAHTRLGEAETKISNLLTRMNTMESTLPDNFTHNNFNDDLSTLDSIKVIRGYYNAGQSRLEV